MVDYRQHVKFSSEVKDIVIADAALTIAFAFLNVGGLGGLLAYPLSFLYWIPISLVAVSLSFILHEYMHKIVAQRFGAIAAFKKWDTGIIITLGSSLFGFLIGLPGATMIYTNRFTKEEDGYVSLAGPLTNFAVFLAVSVIGVFFGVPLFSNVFNLFSGNNVPYIQVMIGMTEFICIWLAFFNMLPIFPLDGSKVLRWNKAVYAATLIAVFACLYVIAGSGILYSLVFLLGIALIMYFFYSGLMRF